MNEPLQTSLDDRLYWVSWKLGVGKMGEAVEVVGMVEVAMKEFNSDVSSPHLFHLSSASSLLRTSAVHKRLAVESEK